MSNKIDPQSDEGIEKAVKNFSGSIRDDAKSILIEARGKKSKYERKLQIVSDLAGCIAMAPTGDQKRLFHKLLDRHNKRFLFFKSGRSLKNDMDGVRSIVEIMNNPTKNFGMLMDLRFVSLSDADRNRIKLATIVQVIFVILIFIFRKSPKAADWSIVFESTALLIATYLVAKCKAVNQDAWNVFLTVAAGCAVLGSVVLIFIP